MPTLCSGVSSLHGSMSFNKIKHSTFFKRTTDTHCACFCPSKIFMALCPIDSQMYTNILRAQMLLKIQQRCLFCHHIVLHFSKCTGHQLPAFLKKSFTGLEPEMLQIWWWRDGEIFLKPHQSLWGQLNSALSSWFGGCSRTPLNKKQHSVGILKALSARELSSSLQKIAASGCVRAAAAARDRTAARDLETCWFPFYFSGLCCLIKEAISCLS